jgi:hypothetical protein
LPWDAHCTALSSCTQGQQSALHSYTQGQHSALLFCTHGQRSASLSCTKGHYSASLSCTQGLHSTLLLCTHVQHSASFSYIHSGNTVHCSPAFGQYKAFHHSTRGSQCISLLDTGVTECNPPSCIWVTQCISPQHMRQPYIQCTRIHG